MVIVDEDENILALIDNFDSLRNRAGGITFGDKRLSVKIPIALLYLLNIGIAQEMIQNEEFVRQLSTRGALADIERFLTRDIFPKIRKADEVIDVNFFPMTIKRFPNFLPVFYRAQLYKNKIILAAVKKYLGPCEILDVGCGTGSFSKYISAAFPKARITAVDSSKGMLNFAKMHSSARNIHYVLGNFPSKPKQNDFDVVANISLSVEEPQELAGMAQKLRKGGIYIQYCSAFDSIEYMTFQVYHKVYGFELIEKIPLPFLYRGTNPPLIIARKI